MLRYIVSILLLGFLWAAATASGNETLSPEERLFFGPAPFSAVPGTLSLDPSGETDTPFLRSEVQWARTARTTTPAEFSGNWGAIKGPAGLRLYAIRFSVGFQSQIKKARENGIMVPEVAWCTPDIKPEKKKPYCFFQERRGMNMSVGSSGAGSAFYPEYIGISSYSGLIEVPEIVEGPFTFDTKLTLEVEIDKIKKSKLKFKVLLNDGEKRSDIFWDDVKFSENGKALIDLWGGQLEITPTGKKTFNVREIAPLDPALALEDKRIFFPYSLRS